MKKDIDTLLHEALAPESAECLPDEVRARLCQMIALREEQKNTMRIARLIMAVACLEVLCLSYLLVAHSPHTAIDWFFAATMALQTTALFISALAVGKALSLPPLSI